MHKIRLDVLLMENGLTESRSMAQRLVMAGQVKVNGQKAIKPSQMVQPGSHLEIIEKPRYVSRGGDKLEAGLQAFMLDDLKGWACVDIGSSTGGFTDCLLHHGAERVYAVNVGYGLIHWKLRNDPRVIMMERTNARNLKSFPEDIRLVTIDVSFISLKIIFNILPTCFGGSPGEVIALIKPQFEAGRIDAAKGEGVIRDPRIHKQVLTEVLKNAESHGISVKGLIRSPLRGPKGNTEFLTYLGKTSTGLAIADLVDGVLEE